MTSIESLDGVTKKDTFVPLRKYRIEESIDYLACSMYAYTLKYGMFSVKAILVKNKNNKDSTQIRLVIASIVKLITKMWFERKLPFAMESSSVCFKAVVWYYDEFW